MAKRDVRWWNKKTPSAVGRSLIDACDRLLDANADRHRMDLRHARLYGGAEMAGLAPWAYSVTPANAARLTCNLVAMCVDTAVSKLCKNRPAPQFLTSGADYETRRKAKALNKFGKGVLHQARWYELDPQQVRDGGIFGTGLVKWYADGKKIRAERALPWEVLVDPLESLYGEPMSLIHRRYVDRTVALESFVGEGRGADARENAIESAELEKSRSYPGRDDTCDQIELIEGWRLPSSPDADDGRHVIVVRSAAPNVVLVDEPWKRASFPFSIFRWEDPVVGFWGRGIAERLTGKQFEVNALLAKIQILMRKWGRTFAFLDAGSGIPATHIDNSLDAVYVGNPGGAPPVIVPTQSVHPEMFQQVDRIIAQAFSDVGITEFAAQGTIPAGLHGASGKALRAYKDTGSERLVVHERRRDAACLDGVRRAIEIARDIPGFTVDVPDKRETTRVEWADVAVEEDDYTLQLFPTSMLDQTLSGRIADVQEMAGAGWISPERALELLDIPDLEDLWSQLNATANYVKAEIEDILDGGTAPSPDPRMKLDVALSHVSAAYLEAKSAGAPAGVLSQLRAYQDELTQMVTDSQKMQAQPAQPAPVAPAAVPVAA